MCIGYRSLNIDQWISPRSSNSCDEKSTGLAARASACRYEFSYTRCFSTYNQLRGTAAEPPRRASTRLPSKYGLTLRLLRGFYSALFEEPATCDAVGETNESRRAGGSVDVTAPVRAMSTEPDWKRSPMERVSRNVWPESGSLFFTSGDRSPRTSAARERSPTCRSLAYMVDVELLPDVAALRRMLHWCSLPLTGRFLVFVTSFVREGWR